MVVRLRSAMLILTACGRLSFDVSFDGATNDVPNRIFITDTLTAGNFGGVAFADQVCADEARLASLTGTFIAFVSDATTSARDRIEGSRGWVRVDGTPIGDTPASMFDSLAIFGTANQTASGALLSGTSTWTGTDPRASPSANCVGWISNSASQDGDGNSVLNATFAGGNIQTCDLARRFVCLEVGHVATVVPRSVAGRIAFVSRMNRSTAINVTNADAICATEASTAGLPGMYKVALATTTTTIASRFTIDTRSWVRVDGTLIAAASDMFSGARDYDSVVNQHADGTYDNVAFWTGVSTAPDAASLLADTCVDWASVAASNAGTRGVSATANRLEMWRNSSNACDSTFHFLCMEE